MVDDEAVYVVLDTETTGLLAHEDRVIEIGALKLVGRKMTQQFHCYLKVDKAISEQAYRVHGIDNDFLKDKPVFADIYPLFLDFVAGATLVIHNAPFDMGFLQAELSRVHYPQKLAQLCPVIDTYVLAKKCYPGQKNSLDALCSRFGINTQHRRLHGALKDADLLVKVYLQLRSRQEDLHLDNTKRQTDQSTDLCWHGKTCLLDERVRD